MKWLKLNKISSHQTHKHCLICFNQGTIFNKYDICFNCLKKLNPAFKKVKIKDTIIYSIYPYQDEIKELLYQFKGCNDLALKDVFIKQYKELIKIKFKNYKIVCAPSYYLHDQERGYNHVKKMFECLNLPFIDCLDKTSKFKQSINSKDQRENITNIIQENENIHLVNNNNILLVDDVVTTGATIARCKEILSKYHPRKIKILIMSYGVSKNV